MDGPRREPPRSGPGSGFNNIVQGDRAALNKWLEQNKIAMEKGTTDIKKEVVPENLNELIDSKQHNKINEPAKKISDSQLEQAKKNSAAVTEKTFNFPKFLRTSFNVVENLFSRAIKGVIHIGARVADIGSAATSAMWNAKATTSSEQNGLNAKNSMDNLIKEEIERGEEFSRENLDKKSAPFMKFGEGEDRENLVSWDDENKKEASEQQSTADAKSELEIEHTIAEPNNAEKSNIDVGLHPDKIEVKEPNLLEEIVTFQNTELRKDEEIDQSQTKPITDSTHEEKAGHLEPIVINQEVEMSQVLAKANEKAQKIKSEIVDTEKNYGQNLIDLQRELTTLVEANNSAIGIKWKTAPMNDELIEYTKIYNNASKASLEFSTAIDQKISTKAGVDVTTLTEEEKANIVKNLSPDDIAEIYNNNALLLKYSASIRDCCAITEKFTKIIYNIDIVATFPELDPDAMKGTGGKIDIINQGIIRPAQRMPRHVMLLGELLKENNIVDQNHTNLELENALLNVKAHAEYINVESGILNDKKTLEDLTKTLGGIIDSDKKLRYEKTENMFIEKDRSDLSRLSSHLPFSVGREKAQEKVGGEKSQEALKKILSDIKIVSKSRDTSINEAAKGLLTTLEKSDWAMTTIQNNDDLKKTFHELSSSTFKDFDNLNKLLASYQLIKPPVNRIAGMRRNANAINRDNNGIGLDENGNLILKNKADVNPEEAKNAADKAKSIFEDAEKKVIVLTEENNANLLKSQENKFSRSTQRYLNENESIESIQRNLTTARLRYEYFFG